MKKTRKILATTILATTIGLSTLVFAACSPTADSTTKPSVTTTAPATTKPSTTAPATTKPSTTAPATTAPSTTQPGGGGGMAQGGTLENTGEVLFTKEESGEGGFGGPATLMLYSDGTLKCGPKTGEWYYDKEARLLTIAAVGNSRIDNRPDADGKFTIVINYYASDHYFDTTISDFEAAIGSNKGKEVASWIGQYKD